MAGHWTQEGTKGAMVGSNRHRQAPGIPTGHHHPVGNTGHSHQEPPDSSEQWSGDSTGCMMQVLSWHTLEGKLTAGNARQCFKQQQVPLVEMLQKMFFKREKPRSLQQKQFFKSLSKASKGLFCWISKFLNFKCRATIIPGIETSCASDTLCLASLFNSQAAPSNDHI